MTELPSLTKMGTVNGMYISAKTGVWEADEITGVTCSVCKEWSKFNLKICPHCKAIMKTVRYINHGNIFLS